MESRAGAVGAFDERHSQEGAVRASPARVGAARDGWAPDRATDPAAGNSAAGQQEQSGTLCAAQHASAAGAGLSLHAEATPATDTIPTIARRANQKGRER